MKQGVTLRGRNRTGPPCSVGRQTAHVPVRWHTDHSCTPRPASLTAGSVSTHPAAGWPACQQCYRRRRRQTTDTSPQNNTGPLGKPVIS